MSRKKAFAFSFRHTYPMLISWIPVALVYGLMMKNAGYNFLWTGLSCIAIPFGTLQMVAVSFFNSTVSWLMIVATAMAMASRHVFYGVSFLERFKKYGASRYYMIYMLCDELYCLYCSYDIPADTDEKWVHIFTALLLQLYWVVLTMASSLLGALIPIDLTGIDFALTALFVTILLDMLRSNPTPLPALTAGGLSIVCLLVFGADSFLIPALILTAGALVLLWGAIEPKTQEVAKLGN